MEVAPRDPVTTEEWQEAADAAEFYLVLESARAYGLVVGGPVVECVRCEDLLRRAESRGIKPRPLEQLIPEFLLKG
jgi:hypothetical protein